MEEYLSMYGWHFSKKMYIWAISQLKKINATTNKQEALDFYTKEQINELFKKHNIVLKNPVAYDYCYIVNQAKAIHFKTSIDDEIHLLKYVKYCLDNVNSYDEMPFTRFYADCIAKGIPIMWEDMI